MRRSAKGSFDASATSSERTASGLCRAARVEAGRPLGPPGWEVTSSTAPGRPRRAPGRGWRVRSGRDATAGLDGPDDRHGVPTIGERVDGARRLSRVEGRHQRPRGERCHRVRPQGTAHGDTRGEPEDAVEVDAHPDPGCGRELVQSARQAPFGRVVQGGRPQLGSGQSRVDDGDARIDKTVGGSPHGLGIERTEARRCFCHEHGRPLDGDGADLGDDVARPRSASGEELAVRGDAQHLADDDGLGDGSSDLGVAPYQRGADLLEGSSDRREQLFHRQVRRAGREQDGGQEPAGPHTHDRDVVGIHDDREPTEVRASQRDGIGRHYEHAGRDGDGAPVFADRRAKKDLRRERREPVEHVGEEVGGDLPWR